MSMTWYKQWVHDQDLKQWLKDREENGDDGTQHCDQFKCGQYEQLSSRRCDNVSGICYNNAYETKTL